MIYNVVEIAIGAHEDFETMQDDIIRMLEDKYDIIDLSLNEELSGEEK